MQAAGTNDYVFPRRNLGYGDLIILTGQLTCSAARTMIAHTHAIYLCDVKLQQEEVVLVQMELDCWEALTE